MNDLEFDLRIDGNFETLDKLIDDRWVFFYLMKNGSKIGWCRHKFSNFCDRNKKRFTRLEFKSFENNDKQKELDAETIKLYLIFLEVEDQAESLTYVQSDIKMHLGSIKETGDADGL